MGDYFRDFGSWLRGQFPFRVQKISVDAGFSCPNRDGRIGTGGCVYCDNRTFNPVYCDPRKRVAEQLADGKRFFAHKYPDMKYLAYFQAFTNTYAPTDRLRQLYEEALQTEDVVGIVIGTRPDCVSDDLLDYLEELNQQTFLIVEYGVESANDETLKRIHRGHDFACAADSVRKTRARGITTGIHLILGLPGEDEAESLRQAPIIAALHPDIVKIHQMQVIRGTQLAKTYQDHPFRIYTVDEYIQLIAHYIRYLPPEMILERFVSQSPADKLIAPQWGLKNYQFTHRLNQYLEEKGICQGDLFSKERTDLLPEKGTEMNQCI